MTTWNFQLRLNREPTEDEFDALYEAGLSDVGVEGTMVDVDREAPTLLKAIASVAAQIRKVPGLRAVGVETDDAVTLADAAQRLGRRTAESLRLLAEGRRGPGGFPAVIVDTGKVRVYSWAEITTWLREALGEEVPAANRDLVLADHALRLAGKPNAVARRTSRRCATWWAPANPAAVGRRLGGPSTASRPRSGCPTRPGRPFRGSPCPMSTIGAGRRP